MKYRDVHVHMRIFELDKAQILLDTLADIGVTDTALQALPYRSPVENLSVLYQKLTYRRMNIKAFGGLQRYNPFENEPYEAQVKRLLELGCDGVKLIDMCPSVRRNVGYGIDDPRYDAMFTLCEDADVPVLIHSADPEEFWDSASERAKTEDFLDESYPAKQQFYDETLRMLDKHPRLRVVLAHFFFLSNDIAEAARVLDNYPNVCFDLTPGWEMFLGFSKNIEAWREFFVKYADRILYGTDSNSVKNFNAQIHELVRTALTHDHSEFIMPCYRKLPVRGLALDAVTVEKICSTNYLRFIRRETPVSAARLREEAASMLTVLAGDEKYARETGWLRDIMKRMEDLT